MLKRRVILCASIGLTLAVCFVAYVVHRTGRQPGFSVVSLSQEDGYPVAKFRRLSQHWKWFRPRAIGTHTRLWVFRANEWNEVSLAEVQKIVSSKSTVEQEFNGKRFARAGYSFDVDVPVAKKWKIDIETYETFRIGTKTFGFDFTQTNRWKSEELPGWSKIRKEFNRTK